MRPDSISSQARLGAALLCTLAHATPAAAQASASTPTPPAAHAAGQHDGQRDFDFIIGRWKAHLRKLLHPLTGSTEWVSYDGSSVITKIWGDRANMEEFDVTSTDPGAARRPRIEGQTIRLYDPESRQWSLYLANAAAGKLLMPPTVGAFKDGRGEFFDHEEFDGRPILVRYVWTAPAPGSARMEQSFSPDWGRTWELNWIVDLSPAP